MIFFYTGGLFKHLQKKYFQTLLQDCEPPFKEITIRVAFFSFAILCLGLLSALFIFFVELVFHQYNKNNSKISSNFKWFVKNDKVQCGADNSVNYFYVIKIILIKKSQISVLKLLSQIWSNLPVEINTCCCHWINVY